MPMELMPHQKDVIDQLGSGKVLWGAVGSGKSATVLAYYVQKESPRDIYVITTAKKRDSLDWFREAAAFGVGTQEGATFHGIIRVDSWNNISRYRHIKDAFFVFDEQRVVGHGTWVKRFIEIARRNHWVLLSATPGDHWLDYAPVFVANGFYKSLSEFREEHVRWEPYVRFPKVKEYLNETKLELLRNDVLVEMKYLSKNRRVMNWIDVGYNRTLFNSVVKDRWHVYEDRPLIDAAEMFRVMRRVVNSDPSRMQNLRMLLKAHPRMIVYYNFDYELEILRNLYDELDVGEWNGHRKTQIPDTERWAYLVQYVAGAEGWNCTTTDSMCLFSLTYSYKNFIQTLGRIDRLDTFFNTLYYYVFVSNSPIDAAIRRALAKKENFNERKYLRTGEGKKWLGEA